MPQSVQQRGPPPPVPADRPVPPPPPTQCEFILVRLVAHSLTVRQPGLFPHLLLLLDLLKQLPFPNKICLKVHRDYRYRHLVGMSHMLRAKTLRQPYLNRFVLSMIRSLVPVPRHQRHRLHLGAIIKGQVESRPFQVRVRPLARHPNLGLPHRRRQLLLRRSHSLKMSVTDRSMV